jgi:hypothetical protein
MPYFHANSSMTPLPGNRLRVSGIGRPGSAGIVMAGIEQAGQINPT